MQKARCGNPDLGTYESIGRPVNVDQPEHLATNVQGRSGKMKEIARSTPHTYFWPKKHLKWFIEEYPKRQKYIKTADHFRRIMTDAFHDWEKHSGLKFEMVSTKDQADLKIKFQSEDHGDGYPFDGQGATLAHAFYPTTGDIHFDDDEYFTDAYKNDYEQYTLRLVAAHEIGHALGLSHSSKEGALMYPLYQQFNSSYELTEDDQQDIQTLYGKPEIKQPKTTLSPKLTSTYSSNLLPIDNWCSGEFQTGCEGPDGELYLFNDNQVWRYQARKKRSWDPQPTSISERFPSLIDTTVTACVKSSMGYTYLFRNYRMWKLKTHWVVDGPHILHGKHYPQNPRVALLHQNSIYLIRNRLIYRLDEFDYDKELEIRTIDTILNPPPQESIQSGFTYDKRHYIFTKRLVYVYDSTHGDLLHGYPKSISNGWFACESASNTRKKSTTITTTTTMQTLTTISSQNHNHNEDDDDDKHFHHHHHHHHHHRPRRPFPFRHHHHHRRPPPPYEYRGGPPPYEYRPPPPPYEYRRRWND
jgi:predicted Zn-dependent protease